MLELIRFIGLIVLIYIVFRVVRSMMGLEGGLGLGKRAPAFKCKSCRHCGKLFEDGALCRFRGRETFKNPTHISNCMDYEAK